MSVSRKNLDKWQIEIDKLDLIKFNSSVIINSLGDIFYYIFSDNNITYYLNGTLHCISGRRRTARDIYLLCKFYKINVSLKHLDYILDKLNDSTISFNGTLCRGFCSGVKWETHKARNYNNNKEYYNQKLDNLKLNILKN